MKKAGACVFEISSNFLSEMIFTAFFSQDPPYRNNERGRSMGVGPMRSRPMEKRHDTSPYSGVPYLSPPPPDTWRRTNSDSALHQSANEACQSTTTIPHRRGTQSFQYSLPPNHFQQVFFFSPTISSLKASSKCLSRFLLFTDYDCDVSKSFEDSSSLVKWISSRPPIFTPPLLRGNTFSSPGRR